MIFLVVFIIVVFVTYFTFFINFYLYFEVLYHQKDSTKLLFFLYMMDIKDDPLNLCLNFEKLINYK
jgi:hypothetical protein